LKLYLLMFCCTFLMAAAQPPSNVPVPAEKPRDAQEKAQENKAPQSETMPETQDNPEADVESNSEPATEEPKKTEPAPTSQERAKCEMQLKRNGAVFEPIKPIRDSAECAIDAPVELRAINASIKLDTPAKLSCDAALALTEWVQQSVVPTLKIAMPDKELTSLANASGYVCRNRNHSANGKISEHAKGNAFDIASFSFGDGSKMVMKPRAKDGTMEGAFQRSITAAACLFFTTVLSPGSDATHQDHLHIDVMKRKNNYRYCM
jgi:hypothetical protein